MERLKTLYIILLCLLGCRSIDMYPTETNWDQNGNDQLDRYEFVAGYIKSNYFLKWGKGRSITGEDFISGVFNSLDTNGDNQLSDAEFEKRIGQFYFWQFTETFGSWDEDRNCSLTKSEFVLHTRGYALISQWDTDADGRIDERELATGMFHVCDVDHDKSVNSLEFNLWKIHR